MAEVQTVTGSVSTDDLGFTLMHEHILVANWAMRMNVRGWLKDNDLVQRAVADVKEAQARGVKTIVDLTPINLGRDVKLMRRVAEESGIQIICATGFYWPDEMWMRGWSADQLVDFLSADILEGIGDTNICAGIIKAATDSPGVTETNRKLLQTAARLHRRTGVPIATHTDVRNHSGLRQQDVFEEEGVDLSRVVIGHSNDTDNLDYLTRILERGSYLGMDRFGYEERLPWTVPVASRIETIAALCARGYADRLVLSHDACCTIDFSPRTEGERALPNNTFWFISDHVIPALIEKGVSDEQVQKMTVENPRRIFEAQGPY